MWHRVAVATPTFAMITGLLGIPALSWAQTLDKKEPVRQPSPDSDAVMPRVVATLDARNRIVFVDPEHVDRAAALWHVDNPSRPQWTIRLHRQKPVTAFVVRKAPRGLSAGITSSIYANCKCAGNSPPHTDDVQCTAYSKGSFNIVQTVGYSYCSPTRTNEDCEAETVQVGDVNTYSDSACSNLVKTSPLMKSVCFP